MATSERNGNGAEQVEDGAKTRGLDPRDTDHPTGSQQAKENADNDPPS